jgi:hypothetical protein
LIHYAQTGNLPIDNNPVENAIRPIALDKKNWLFAGSKRAGKRAAAIQSLFATTKLNGIEPAAWLKDTLEKLPSGPCAASTNSFPSYLLHKLAYLNRWDGQTLAEQMLNHAYPSALNLHTTT